MDNNIIFIKACSIKNTRLLKMASFFHKEGYSLHFIGWDREREKESESPLFTNISYIYSGGGFGSGDLSMLILHYLIFQIKLFFHLFLINNKIKNKIYFAINFDVAFIVYCVSLIRPSIKYFYEIRDEFSKTYRIPRVFLPLFNIIEKKIRNRAIKTIHVDVNRVAKFDRNYLVINNSPFDFYKNKPYIPQLKKSFAVTGYLNYTRGLSEILNFANSNEDYTFYVIGRFIDQKTKKRFLELPNIQVYDYMPQDEVFNIISECRGIFSLYEPSLEINRLAASNKLYDAMMLGIPVIVNKEIVASTFVDKYNIGFSIDYFYNETWSTLIDSNLSDFQIKGMNGRKLYLSSYEFGTQLSNILLPLIDDIFTHNENH